MQVSNGEIAEGEQTPTCKLINAIVCNLVRSPNNSPSSLATYEYHVVEESKEFLKSLCSLRLTRVISSLVLGVTLSKLSARSHSDKGR